MPIHASDGVHLQYEEQEDQPRPDLDFGTVVHIVVRVIEGECLLAAPHRGNFLIVYLVRDDSVAERSSRRLVVGKADE